MIRARLARRSFGGQSPQAVVGARARRPAPARRQSIDQSSRRKPAGRRVAGDAGVDDLVVEPRGVQQSRRQLRRIGLVQTTRRSRRSGCRPDTRCAAVQAVGRVPGRPARPAQAGDGGLRRMDDRSRPPMPRHRQRRAPGREAGACLQYTEGRATGVPAAGLVDRADQHGRDVVGAAPLQRRRHQPLARARRACRGRPAGSAATRRRARRTARRCRAAAARRRASGRSPTSTSVSSRAPSTLVSTWRIG